MVDGTIVDWSWGIDLAAVGTAFVISSLRDKHGAGNIAGVNVGGKMSRETSTARPTALVILRQRGRPFAVTRVAIT
jgi:hypothetical protein